MISEERIRHDISVYRRWALRAARRHLLGTLQEQVDRHLTVGLFLDGDADRLRAIIGGGIDNFSTAVRVEDDASYPSSRGSLSLFW